MWTCALSTLVVQGGIIYRILELSQSGASTTSRPWLDTTFVPNSVIAFSAIFPFIIMASSTWALSVNVSRGRIKTKRRDGGAAVGQSGSLPSQSTSQIGSASISVPAESAIGVANQSEVALQSARNRTYSTLASVSTAVLSAAKRTKRVVTSGSNRQNGQFMYPLSRTFIVLSFALISLWIFAMAASILEFLPYTRTNALNSALNATCIAVEASFEKLLRCAKQAQQKKDKELAMNSTFGGVTEDVAMEQSQADVESHRLGTELVVPAAARTHTT
ncbi:hypothetical protein BCR44DRAFT_43635 [Catenaria anguillulae PL171]|uniref:Uncharacterized protein n=1 Tax=Catenaria anguillulae PL171 TaxID=765915 RepID=A0A1Y2HVK8_9FUNG|nr:hypothetical protein BCR44DRAFT_43635 [Catenaria anguillulae PL171]